MSITATWMRWLDERILEYLNEVHWSTPSMMAGHPEFDEMEVSRRRLRERCKVLVGAELVAREHRDIYEITRLEQLYLEGEVDAQNQTTPRPERVF